MTITELEEQTPFQHGPSESMSPSTGVTNCIHTLQCQLQTDNAGNVYDLSIFNYFSGEELQLSIIHECE